MLSVPTADNTTSLRGCPQILESTLPAGRECLGICDSKGQTLARCRRANTPSAEPGVGRHGWMCPLPCSQDSTAGLSGSTQTKITCTGILISRLHLGSLTFSRQFLKLSTETSILLGEVMPFMLQSNYSHRRYCQLHGGHWEEGPMLRTVSNPSGGFLTKRRCFIFHTQKGAHSHLHEFKSWCF